jgi:hypothetical protein
MTIPDKAARSGKYLKFNDTTGNPEAGSIAYNVSGAVVQFSAAPPNLSTIEVMVIQVLPVGATTASQVSGSFNQLSIIDGVSAPSTVSGSALIYVDSADGDLKIKFGDGTVKTIATDT